MNKLQMLRQELKKYDKLCIGFSGGTDSSFLLKVAAEELGKNCLAVIADGPMVSRRDLNAALDFAQEINVQVKVITIDPLTIEEFRVNDKKRCYHCKKNIFTKIKEIAEPVADGKNADDEKIYRPGQQATRELGIISPLCDLGFSKQDIRQFSKELGIRTWNKMSNACLATRIPYDENINLQKLKTIEDAEDYLYDMGFQELRVRLHGDLARIELPTKDFNNLLQANGVIQHLKNLGIKYITLDIEGFRSGSMDL